MSRIRWTIPADVEVFPADGLMPCAGKEVSKNFESLCSQLLIVFTWLARYDWPCHPLPAYSLQLYNHKIAVGARGVGAQKGQGSGLIVNHD